MLCSLYAETASLVNVLVCLPYAIQACSSAMAVVVAGTVSKEAQDAGAVVATGRCAVGRGPLTAKTRPWHSPLCSWSDSAVSPSLMYTMTVTYVFLYIRA